MPAPSVKARSRPLIGHAKQAQTNLEALLGAALLAAAAAMVMRHLLDRQGGAIRSGLAQEIVVHPARTVATGMLGRVIAGMTSAGSGSPRIIDPNWAVLECARPLHRCGQSRS